MQKIFISDIIFSKQYFPELSKNTIFLMPYADYIDMIEENLIKGGEILVGWSAGAHLISKNINTFCNKWKKIILINPYSRLTDNISEQSIDTLIKGLDKDFTKTISYYLSKTGANTKILPDKNIKKQLIETLLYFKKSEVKSEGSASNIDIVYGSANQIIKRSTILNFLKIFKNARFMEVDQPHFVSESLLLSLIH